MSFTKSSSSLSRNNDTRYETFRNNFFDDDDDDDHDEDESTYSGSGGGGDGGDDDENTTLLGCFGLEESQNSKGSMGSNSNSEIQTQIQQQQQSLLPSPSNLFVRSSLSVPKMSGGCDNSNNKNDIRNDDDNDANVAQALIGLGQQQEKEKEPPPYEPPTKKRKGTPRKPPPPPSRSVHCGDDDDDADERTIVLSSQKSKKHSSGIVLPTAAALVSTANEKKDVATYSPVSSSSLTLNVVGNGTMDPTALVIPWKKKISGSSRPIQTEKQIQITSSKLNHPAACLTTNHVDNTSKLVDEKIHTTITSTASAYYNTTIMNKDPPEISFLKQTVDVRNDHQECGDGARMKKRPKKVSLSPIRVKTPSPTTTSTSFEEEKINDHFVNVVNPPETFTISSSSSSISHTPPPITTTTTTSTTSTKTYPIKLNLNDGVVVASLDYQNNISPLGSSTIKKKRNKKTLVDKEIEKTTEEATTFQYNTELITNEEKSEKNSMKKEKKSTTKKQTGKKRQINETIVLDEEIVTELIEKSEDAPMKKRTKRTVSPTTKDTTQTLKQDLTTTLKDQISHDIIKKDHVTKKRKKSKTEMETASKDDVSIPKNENTTTSEIAENNATTPRNTATKVVDTNTTSNVNLEKTIPKEENQKVTSQSSKLNDSASGKQQPMEAKMKKKKPSFQDTVFNHMLLEFKPFTIRTLSESIKDTSESALEFLMLTLVDKGLVIKKDFVSPKGMTKTLYWANHDGKAKEVQVTFVTEKEMNHARIEMSTLRNEITSLNHLFIQVTDGPSNHELNIQLQMNEIELNEIQKQYHDMKNRIRNNNNSSISQNTTTTTVLHRPVLSTAPSNVNRNQKTPSAQLLLKEKCPNRLKQRFNYMRNEWKNRKEKCMDFLEQLADCMEKKCKDMISLIDIEMDDDNNNGNTKIPPLYKITK